MLVISIENSILSAQTREIINLAEKTDIKIIVVISKIDKGIKNLQKITKELSQYSIISKKYGGNNNIVKISIRTGEGIKKLLKSIIYLTKNLNLDFSHNSLGKGVVIESYILKGMGPASLVFIEKGIFNKNDYIIYNSYKYCKIKNLINVSNKQLAQTKNATIVTITGFSELPDINTEIIVKKNEKNNKKNL